MAKQAVSMGYIWEVNEEPICSYCSNVATRSTLVSGVHLCDDNDCAMQFVSENSNPIEYESIPECNCCNVAEGVNGAELEECEGCSVKFCQDCLIGIPPDNIQFCPDCVSKLSGWAQAIDTVISEAIGE